MHKEIPQWNQTLKTWEWGRGLSSSLMAGNFLKLRRLNFDRCLCWTTSITSYQSNIGNIVLIYRYCNIPDRFNVFVCECWGWAPWFHMHVSVIKLNTKNAPPPSSTYIHSFHPDQLSLCQRQGHALTKDTKTPSERTSLTFSFSLKMQNFLFWLI